MYTKPIIKPSTEIRKDYGSISKLAKETGSPVFITKNGAGISNERATVDETPDISDFGHKLRGGGLVHAIHTHHHLIFRMSPRYLNCRALTEPFTLMERDVLK